MRSGLPLYWAPCFDGPPFTNERGYASWWTAAWQELLRDAPSPLMQYFIFAMLQPSADPIEFLGRPVSQDEQQQLFSVEERRNLWCAGILAHIVGRRIVLKGGEYVAVAPGADQGYFRKEVFAYIPATVTVDDNAVTHIGSGSHAKPVMLFRIIDRANYAGVMTSVTQNLLAELEK